MLRGAVPRLGDVVFMSILVGGMLLGPRMLNVDSDLGRHLTLGSYMLNTRTIPSRDVLSFTRSGYPRPPYEWLSQIVFALANRWLGLGGVVLLTSLAIATAFGIVFADGLGRSHSPVLALLLAGWSAAASSLHWLTRPHVFSFGFFALWIAALERLRTGHRIPSLVFPFIMLAWANTHGGFVLGFLAWAAYMAGWLIDANRRAASKMVGAQLLLAGTTSFAASIITPDLWHNWEAVLQNRSPFILARTAETLSPSFSSPATWPFLAMLGLSLIGTVLRFRSLVPAHGLLLGGLALGSVAMARNIPFFAIAAAPILMVWGDETLRDRSQWVRLQERLWSIDSGLRGLIWPALLVAAIVGLLFHKPETPQVAAYRFNVDAFPVGAVDWVQAHPLMGNMFNDFNWGGYLLYRLWPGQRVFIDSQSDFYGEDLTRQYEQLILGGDGWQSLLDRYNIGWVIVAPSSGLSRKLAVDAGWNLLYADHTAAVFDRIASP